MPKRVLFIQGAGEGAHAMDAKLAESLRRSLGPDHDVQFPLMPNEADPEPDAWKRALQLELAGAGAGAVLVAHSVGGSLLLRLLAEAPGLAPIAGLFLLAVPFWGGAGWRYDGFEKLALPRDLSTRLPRETPVFAYHCQDDETVPVAHLDLYAGILPRATVRRLAHGGHQFSEGLGIIADDVRALGTGTR